jgi:plasmid stability protein
MMGIMAELRIRKLDDWVTSWLKAQAGMHGRSLEKELRELLTETVRTRKKQIADELLDGLETLEKRHWRFTEGTKGIREERDRRG